MVIALDQLPDDVDALKALIIDQAASNEKIDNNGAENATRPFVVGRKNCVVQSGALCLSSALVYRTAGS